MPSKHLINAELLQACNGEPPVVNVNAENLQAMREYLVALSASFADPLVETVRLSRRQIAGPEQNQMLEVLIYTPEGLCGPAPGILHLHGGGFVMGSAAMDEGYCKKMANDTGCVIVSVDYRLAPETRFPGALEDSYAALRWMESEAEKLGIDPARLAITGESAGAGLAASLAILVRDRKEISLRLQFLTYPMLDDRTASTVDPGAVFGEYAWTRTSNKFGWESYLGAVPGGSTAPYPAVPARIENLAGVAPAFIVCGALDLLAVENLSYAQRLLAQGVPTEIHVYAGAFHGFPGALGTELAKEFFAERKRVFKNALS